MHMWVSKPGVLAHVQNQLRLRQEGQVQLVSNNKQNEHHIHNNETRRGAQGKVTQRGLGGTEVMRFPPGVSVCRVKGRDEGGEPF